jgi:hypothetical protein
MTRMHLVLVAALAVAAGPAPAQLLTSRSLAGGATESYHVVGNPDLALGLAQADRYWSGVVRGSPRMLRGAMDDYLSPALQAMEDRAATDLARIIADTLFGGRDPRTGLVPYSFDAASELAGGRTGGRQPVDLVYRAALLLRWLPEDAALARRAGELAEATIRAFDAGGGVWAWAPARGGRGDLPGLHPVQLGQMAEGMHEISRRTGNPRYARWADAKLAWALAQAPAPGALACGTFTPTRRQDADGGLCDTDILYLARRLFTVHRMSGNPLHREWALRYTDAWYRGGWSSRGHFVRRVRPGGGAATDALYGDGNYNTLWVMTAAFRATGDRRYAARLAEAWRGLRDRGVDGLAPAQLRAGRGNGQPDPQQTLFLVILLDAYAATGDAEFLRMAASLGDAIRRRGESVMRMEAGQAADAFMRLGLARVPMRRLEVDLRANGATLELIGGQGREVLRGPRRVAVVYLPRQGWSYRLGGGASRVSERNVATHPGSADR